MKPLSADNNGCCVVVTQPAPACDALCDLLHEQGVVPLHLPSYRITHTKVEANEECILSADTVIVTSQHVLQKGKKRLPNRPYIAIGPSTATALKRQGLTDITQPKHPSSEGLLELLSQHALRGLSVVVLSGENPRPFLAEALKEQGAQVDYLFYYRREPTQYSIETLTHLMTKNIMAITIHSADGLRYLADTLSQKPDSPLWSAPLLLVSERYAALAAELSFTGPCMISASSSPEDIVETLFK